MTSIALSAKAAKLMKLCEAEGFNCLDDLLAASITDSVCPAICMKAGLRLRDRDGARSRSRLLRGVRWQYRRLGSRARRPHLREGRACSSATSTGAQVRPGIDRCVARAMRR